MNWPWAINKQREHLLSLRIADLEKAIAHEKEQTAYFRSRYDRLADLMLVRQVHPSAVAPVHVEAKPADGSSLGSLVARAGAMAGNAAGIPFKAPKPVTDGLDIHSLTR